MPKGKGFHDQTGKRFGRLTVIEDLGMIDGEHWCRCRCDCGNVKDIRYNSMQKGTTTSCGCYRREAIKKASEKRKDVEKGTNLRILTGKISKRNKIGHKGVGKGRKPGTYVAYLAFQGKLHWLGTYYSLEEAVAAREEAERKYHDPFLKELGLK